MCGEVLPAQVGLSQLMHSIRFIIRAIASLSLGWTPPRAPGKVGRLVEARMPKRRRASLADAVCGPAAEADACLGGGHLVEKDGEVLIGEGEMVADGAQVALVRDRRGCLASEPFSPSFRARGSCMPGIVLPGPSTTLAATHGQQEAMQGPSGDPHCIRGRVAPGIQSGGPVAEAAAGRGRSITA